MQDAIKQFNVKLMQRIKAVSGHKRFYIAYFFFFGALSASLFVWTTETITTHLEKSITKNSVKIIHEDLAKSIEEIKFIKIKNIINNLKNKHQIIELCLYNDYKILITSINSNCIFEELSHNTLINTPEKTVGYLYLKTQDNHNTISFVVFISISMLTLLVLAIPYIFIRRIHNEFTLPLAQLNSSVLSFLNEKDFHIRFDYKEKNAVSDLGNSFNEIIKVMRTKEHDLLKSKKLAEDSNNLKSEFLASVSHEIRTPMNGIIGTAELLMEGLENDKQRNYVNTILKSSESLLEIINDILDLSKVESGKLDFESIPMDLQKVIEDISDLMATKANEKGLEIILALSPYIKEEYIGDPNRIRQVITNLVNNAIKFTYEGHILISVDVEKDDRDSRNHRLAIAVSDTGIGISEEALGRIFDKFAQAESSTSRNFGGTGLGLAICKQLIELMGGKISVKSELHKGTCFSFYLDLEYKRKETFKSHFITKAKILIIDDNPFLLNSLKQLLAFHGAECLSFTDPFSAIKTINENEQGRYDLILIDEDMASISGYEIAERIGLLFADNAPPIIILNEINADSRQNYIYSKHGIFANINKPIKNRELLEVVAKVVDDQATSLEKEIKKINEILPHQKPSNNNFLVSPVITIIEDNDIHFKAIETALANCGALVTRATSLDISNAAYQKQYTDLLIIGSYDSAINENALDENAITNLFQFADSTLKKHRVIILCQSHNESKNSDIGTQYLAKNKIHGELRNLIFTILSGFKINKNIRNIKTKNASILLVEDNRTNAHIIKEFLNDIQCHIEYCENGEVAIKKFMASKFDAILMDCQMPVMNGFDCTDKIRDLESSESRIRTPVIAITANAMKGDNEKCIKAGMDDYISKPIKRESLITAICRHIPSNKLSLKTLASAASASDQSAIENTEDHTNPENVSAASESSIQQDSSASSQEPKTENNVTTRHFATTITDKQQAEKSDIIDKKVFSDAKNVFKNSFKTILQEYIEDADGYIEAIKIGLKESDLDAIRQSAHPFKSSSYSLGFNAVGDVAKVIESYSKENRAVDDIEREFQYLVPEYEQLNTALNTYLESDT